MATRRLTASQRRLQQLTEWHDQLWDANRPAAAARKCKNPGFVGGSAAGREAALAKLAAGPKPKRARKRKEAASEPIGD